MVERKRSDVLSLSSSGTDLTQGNVAQVLLGFSLPFMIGTLLQTLYSTVDMIVVGQFLGGAGLSGVSNGSQFMQMVTMVCIGFSNAGQVLLSQAKGAGSQERIQRIAGTLLYIMLVVSLFLGLLCVIGSRLVLTWMRTPEEAFDEACSYITICGIGMIFTGLYNMFSALYRGVGDSRHPLLFVAIASGINLVLDIVLVVCFGMGVAGAAWATVIGQAVSVLFCVRFLHRHPQILGFQYHLYSLIYDPHEGRVMIRIGIPMALQSGAIQTSFLFVSGMINSGGLIASAAFGVTQKLRNLPGILTQGLGLGATSMIGQNLGAGKTERIRKIILIGILFCSVICGIFGMIFVLLPDTCFRLFTQDADVLSLAALCTMTLLIELPGKALMPSCNALVQAQGFAAFSLFIAILDAVVGRVFLCWLFGIYMGKGTAGFLLGYTLATYFTAIPLSFYFFSGLWKKRALL